MRYKKGSGTVVIYKQFPVGVVRNTSELMQQNAAERSLGAGSNGVAKGGGYKIEPINRLAFPRGQVPKCELTGLVATVQCVCDHITLFYATAEHAEQAWHGIVHKIAPLLGSLRAVPVIGSEEERAKREYTLLMCKRALIDLCQQEANKFLVQGSYDLAIPGAIQALVFSKDVFGAGSIEMVPPYLLLSEANLCLGRLQSAEEFLSLANWSILKNPSCSNAIRSQLHRNFGKLYTTQSKFDEALQELARDIYCSSLEVGPEHIDTSAGYFLMANIFYAQRKVDSALTFYDKVVDVWYKFLASVRGDPKLADAFHGSQLSKGMDMLTRILTTRMNVLGESHIATGEAKYTIGLLYLFVGEFSIARENLEGAREIYDSHLGPEHPSTKDVNQVIAQIDSKMTAGDRIEARAADDPAGGETLPLFETNNSRESLMSQFPVAENLPMAVSQTPIPFPPESREGYEDDAMRMSPPQTPDDR